MNSRRGISAAKTQGDDRQEYRPALREADQRRQIHDFLLERSNMDPGMRDVRTVNLDAVRADVRGVGGVFEHV